MSRDFRIESINVSPFFAISASPRVYESEPLQVTHLDDKKSPVKYVSLKSLPFSVVSIDSIQQVPVASVAYDYKTIPLEKGDALAGWKVVSVDYGKQRLELENTRAERVLITHEHIG